MAEIQIPNVRQESTVLLPTRLKDNGVTVDWSSLGNIKAYMYSDVQRVIAGKCSVEVDGEDSSVLNVTYPATRPQYLGVNSLLIRCTYQGRQKTFDLPVVNFVERSAEADGVTVLDDPEMDVTLEVDEVSTSLLDGAIAAALDAAVKAEEAASLVPFEVLEEAREATEAATEAAAAANAAGITSVQASVADNEPGTPSVDVTLLNKVLALVFHHLKGLKGDAGVTPNISVGTVSTGAPGSPVVVTITGTAEAPVLNLTIPQGAKGEQGNTGSSVDYPFELVNNLTTDDADKALSAAQGVVLDGKISQLSQEVDDAVDITLVPGTKAADIVWNNGYYINLNGVKTAHSEYAYTNPVPVKKGQMAIVYVKSYLFSAISKTDANGSSYVPVVKAPTNPGVSTPVKYTYYVDEDGYLAFSGLKAGAGYTPTAFVLSEKQTFTFLSRFEPVEYETIIQKEKLARISAFLTYEIRENAAVVSSPYGDIGSSSYYDTILADVSTVEKTLNVVLAHICDNIGYALYNGVPSSNTIIGRYTSLQAGRKEWAISLNGAKFIAICVGKPGTSYSGAYDQYPVLYGDTPVVGVGINIFEPFRTLKGREEYLYKDSIIASQSPSVMLSIRGNLVRQPLQDYSAKALKFASESAGVFPVVVSATNAKMEVVDKTINITVVDAPAKKLANRSSLRVMFFGDSLIYANNNLIGEEWLRMLNTNDPERRVDTTNNSVMLPTLNATDGKIVLYGTQEYYAGAKYTSVGSAYDLCTGKSSSNPFYNPNSSEADEIGDDGMNKRVDFGWWFDNNLGQGEYPDLIYMALGPNDFANVYNWSEDGIEPTTNRVVAICKKIKSVCDERAGGSSSTVIKIIQHQPYTMQGNPTYNFPPLTQRVLWQKCAEAYVSAFQVNGINNYVELIPCASRFDIELGYTLTPVANNPRYDGDSDKAAVQTIHMNPIGSYNYADVLVTDFMADTRFD